VSEKSRAAAELTAIGGCGLLNILIESAWMSAKVPVLAAVALGWAAYLIRRRARWRDWGWRTDNLRALAPPLMALSLAALLAGAAFARGPLPAASLWIFAIYPVWGLLQQFALQVLVTRNLRAVGLAPFLCATIAALLFGLSHWPDAALAGLTGAAGLLWSALYLWRPNLWALGLCHAWLGTLAYYWVLHRDPWGEMFRF
jgi:hypothetical protein